MLVTWYSYIGILFYRFFNRLYAEYQQLVEVKRLKLQAANPDYDDAMLQQVHTDP